MALRPVRLVLIALLSGVLVACGGSGSPGSATPESSGGATPSVVPSTAAAGTTATCPPGSDPDAAGPAQQARPQFADWSRASAAFDRQSGRVVHVDSTGETWTFDVCTNTWTHVSTRGDNAAEGAYFFYDAVDDLTYAINEGQPFPTVRTYDVETSTWTPVAPSRGLPMWEGPDPRFVMDPTARVIYGYQFHTGQLRAYDIAANTWTEVRQGEPRPPTGEYVDGLAAFDPTVRRIVLWSVVTAETWTFDPGSKAWERVSTPDPSLNFNFWKGTEMAYDEASRRSVAFAEGTVAAFDATANRWSVAQTGTGWPSEQGGPLTPGALTRIGHGLVDDVVNGRVLVLGGSVRTPQGPWWLGGTEESWQEGTDVWAYDVGATTWIELVAPQPN